MNDSVGPLNFEIINPDRLRGPFRCAVFDFDGTLSLLRGDWQGLIVPMMVEAMAATGTGESAAELTAIVEEFVTRLTGQPTMQQMLALCDELEKRCGPRLDPQGYLDLYLEFLISRTEARIGEIRAGRKVVADFLVPGSLPLLKELHGSGMLLVMASGTELGDIRRESNVLGIDHFFGSHIHGPVNNDASFSKERVLRSLTAERGLRGNEMVAFGDGPAEILAVKAVGGLAIGVCSDEIHRDGRVNRLKRDHLLRAGADVLIADYRDLDAVLSLIFPIKDDYS
jgi:phosphoglycolate phosphatase